MKHLFRPFFGIFSLALLVACGSSNIISAPIENINDSPLKIKDLTQAEKESWGLLDLAKDTIPGMGVERAYSELLQNKKAKTVIVAVIDSGIDIEHEDLDDVVWTNEGEVPGNGIDDDKNGYIDDIHGWNFLGAAYDEQLEYVRLLSSADSSNPRFEEAKKLFDSEYQKYSNYKTQYEQLSQQLSAADLAISKQLGKSDYTEEDIEQITSDDPSINQAVQILMFFFNNGMSSVSEAKTELNNGLESINERLNYNLNKDFKGRTTGDNPNDITVTVYGDANVLPVKKQESHGTHVAGIIAAERNNGLGMNGVADHVEIMSLRVVPNGDEYDKDVALAIRYAVDNGAKVINGSFGKSFSPHKEWVWEAIKYAAENDVVIVHAAGNDSNNIDVEPNFPTDDNNGQEVADNYISVGSLTSSYGSKMVSGFSNYGKQNVDIFAPGSSIYSTTPENEYMFKGGTSMAAPAVAGIAALVRSYYPKLSASQVKQSILNSGLSIDTKVIVGGEASDVRDFSTLSKTGKIANAYNALIIASKI